MNNSINSTIGSTKRTHLEITEICKDSVKIAVMKPNISEDKILKAFVWIGSGREGGYEINRVDGYCLSKDKIDIRKVIFNLLSATRFAAIISK
jgi:hypothetical protein